MRAASTYSFSFADKTDPGYRQLLALCVAGKERLEKIGRFDMPVFRPREDWVREMRRYGILPDATPREAVTDPYAVERRYWESLWYRPVPAVAAGH